MLDIQEMVVPSLSRKAIRGLAFRLRQALQLENVLRFPIVESMELLAATVDDFELEICTIGEMKHFHGLTMENGIIRIREDVYLDAVKGDGCARDTMAHELGHWLMHRGNKAHAKLAGGVVPAYASPEWQAKAFAGELLVPCHLITRTMGVREVAEKCGVSCSAAKYQLSKIPR